MAESLAGCGVETVGWNELGANSQADYASRCRQEWGDRAAELDSRELELALESCEGARVSLQDMTCEELGALYTHQTW